MIANPIVDTSIGISHDAVVCVPASQIKSR